MKYHYQFVSKTTVRIELIPEDKREKELLLTFSKELDNNLLTELFQKGLQGYAAGTSLVRTNFMSFPHVALCSYITEAKLTA
ncbi:MAG: hypothetical protein EOO96_32445 [Pedobacter sp.]|nr:MAG: hypothetical protein EOO96_32445 [Pedobacter sp.]